MPFLTSRRKARKPLPKAYPARLATIGDHIRAKRLDLKLYQREVADVLAVTESTVTNWEKNRTGPRLHLFPRIIMFLGYDPLQSNATSLGEKIKQYRIQKGLSLRKLARELDIDPVTLARWEKGENEPRKNSQNWLDMLRLF